MEVREEHWDESLWRNSLKLHLTGRNAAGISRDSIRAALLAVWVNPKDIVDLWRGEVSHQINLSFMTEGGVMACLTADTIDLPNGVKGNFLHANRTLADIKVHWVPACFIVQELCESRGGRPGLSVLTSLLVSVDVKIYCTVLRHWSQLVPNMSHDI